MDIDKPQDTVTPLRSVIEVMDDVFVKEGLEKGIPEEETRRRLKIERQLADLFDEEWAKGRSIEEIENAWEGKTPEEILSGETTIQEEARRYSSSAS